MNNEDKKKCKYIYGIDIGGTTVKIGLFSDKGDLIERWEIPTRRDEGGELILNDICETIKKKMKNISATKEDIVGVGVGVPGPVLEDGTVNKCVNIGWGVFNVEEELSKMLDGITVKAGNDANVAALGEQWKGGGTGHQNMIMVTLGTGVGGGVIIGGKIIPGSFGAGGEIGHIQMSKTESAICGCGKTGCLEQYASATGIVRIAQKLLRENNSPSILRNVQYLSAKEIFDCAKNGDELSLQLVDMLGEMLGTALSYISCVVDPEIYVIGGGVSKAGTILLESIQHHFETTAFHTSRKAKFSLATLGNDAGMYGAAKLVIKN